MTAEVIVAPDAAALLVAYLDAVLDVDVAYTVPDQRPTTFVSMAITGGGGRRDVVLQDVTVTIDAWGENAKAAHDLASLIEAHLHAAQRENTGIYNVGTFGAPSDFPDPLSGHARSRATYSLTLRASAL